MRRFLRELRVAASIDSPHVVRVYELGDESAPMPYLAMELLKGEDLAQILREEPRLAAAEVVEMVRQVGLGLAVVAYRALTGHPPFKGDDLPVLMEVLARMPARPGALAELDPDVDAFFAVALAKQPAKRFQTAAQLCDALAAALEGKLDPALRERARALLGELSWCEAG